MPNPNFYHPYRSNAHFKNGLTDKSSYYKDRSQNLLKVTPILGTKC